MTGEASKPNIRFIPRRCGEIGSCQGMAWAARRRQSKTTWESASRTNSKPGQPLGNKEIRHRAAGSRWTSHHRKAQTSAAHPVVLPPATWPRNEVRPECPATDDSRCAPPSQPVCQSCTERSHQLRQVIVIGNSMGHRRHEIEPSPSGWGGNPELIAGRQRKRST